MATPNLTARCGWTPDALTVAPGPHTDLAEPAGVTRLAW